MNEQADKIAVKRDGPRGWHWIARANYDPKVHVLHKANPLDGDADGKAGGSMPDKPAPQAEAEGEPAGEPAAKPKRKVSK